MVMLDIDLFKAVNDQYGHAAGDAVIEMVGQVCSDNIRENIDFAGRLGGEEFAILLPESSMDAAALFAERLRKAIENVLVEVDNKHISVTVSLGVAELDNDEDTSNLIRRADDALYASKSSGRNQVQTAA
jgi:diguanylate cyclase (GGDEF)-like protein